MLYHYLAADKTGRLMEADLDADNLAQVLQHLAGEDLRPITVKPAAGTVRGARSFFGRIRLTDKIFLTKYLSLMLRVGTDLLSAINILIADFDKAAMKNFLIEVRENLSHGRPFHETFAHHPKTFSPVFVNLVKAAEASGNLQQTFDDLSGALEREAELRGHIRAALIYPIILLVAALLVFIFLVTFALPRIAQVFLESGINPPIFSRVVFGIGLFVNDNFLVLSIIFLSLAIPGALFVFRTHMGRHMMDRLISHLPIIKRLYRDIAVQQFATTFSSLLKAGLPIIQAMRITAEVIGAEEFRVALMRIADEGLSKGLTVGEAFKRETVFPKVVTNLVAISEKAGHLDDVLRTLADFYASNIDANVRTLVAFLEPALLLMMGVIVGTIALAIIVPIYQLTAQF
ncbi:MAG: hypothetical protein A3A43_01755 [Candidatus Liptonbacteria bacterium RIFCSPLOWO2_01_FULL_56_20]|uniref:Type II secretion system protein GspF domain-containing protein n=1 Tax=Candidatus Liptonbacteria bacterium RIFCSPLOWO2_01_FULL_56_20 TaxID=1798652 RepID=A0A1G2CJN2_9BACT|nr:MAG: Type 4 fimbrial assembly protein pilC [Parcubacteria group bacterium GW2011_GWB1_56_8]OGZ01613.1 MAG: hypothetical protein A3A43_01755 [Candidatus Liptonbacteria bacterium RIFCSPLOWO2_01_FULL_56_20]